MAFKVLIVLFCALALVNIAQAIVCTKQICDGVTCPSPLCVGENQEIRKGGFCNCCNVCVTILKEGESCGSRVPLLGVPPPDKSCPDGQACYENQCQKISDILVKQRLEGRKEK